MKFGEYLDLVRKEPQTRQVVTEYDTPATLFGLFETPSLCRPEGGPSEILSNIFMANQGNIAHLHFDQDHRQVLLVQVFGRKRVILFHPRAARRLQPVNNYSAFCLESLQDEDK